MSQMDSIGYRPEKRLAGSCGVAPPVVTPAWKCEGRVCVTSPRACFYATNLTLKNTADHRELSFTSPSVAPRSRYLSHVYYPS